MSTESADLERVAEVRSWTNPATNETGQRLYMWCPGCDDLHSPEVGTAGAWTWDGNIEAPTVNPSILVTGVQWAEGQHFHKPTHAVAAGQPIRCHSFVRQGRWEFLGDCTHHLAAQMVPLPPLPNGRTES